MPMPLDDDDIELNEFTNDALDRLQELGDGQIGVR